MKMKTIFKIFLLMILVGFWACEKNDPLADQGELTGEMVPFNLLAQMPDAPAGDTITVRNVSWAVGDDIETITLYHSGFKLRDYEVKLRVQTTNETVDLSVKHLEDSVLFASTFIAEYPEEGATLNDYYQTLENAYVILHDFIVPMQYALTKDRDEELIMAMNDQVLNAIVVKFSEVFNRAVMTTVFPEVNPFNLNFFVVDDEGNITGEITDEGKLYIIDNMDRELLIDFLREAAVSDNTRVTVESVARLEGSEAGASSERTFRVL